MTTSRLIPSPIGTPGSIARAYVEADPTVRAFFPGPQPVGPPRLPANALHVTGGGEQRLQRILSGDGCFVSTGQQPNLFVGPLYIVYKALTARAQAKRIERQTGRPAMPLFWIASDDHDWAEVARTRVIDGRGLVHEIGLEPTPQDEGASVGTALLTDEVGRALDAFVTAIGGGEQWSEWEGVLRAAYRPGNTYGAAFLEALQAVLGEREFAWLDSGAPEVRLAAAPLYRAVIERSEAVDDALRRGTEAVRQAGYEPQLHHVAGSPPIFMAAQEGRVRLRGGDEILPALDANPERYTPSAALRPVLESYLLPVAMTVLGPGEIAYWSQLGPLFREMGVPMPEVVTRQGWLIVDAVSARNLERLGATWTDVADGGGGLGARLVELGRPARVETALASLEIDLRAGLEALEAAVIGELPGIAASVGKTGKRMATSVEELRKAMDRQVRQRQEVALERVRKTAGALFPAGAAQERIQTPFAFLAREGATLIDQLDAEGSRLLER